MYDISASPPSRKIDMPNTTTFLDKLPDAPKINELHAYWKSICGEHSIPDRKDFSPVAIKKHLANIAILEVDLTSEAFEIRLFGTALMEMFGEDRTGRTQSNLTHIHSDAEVERLALARWQEVLRKTVEKKEPIFFQSPRLRTGYRHQFLEGVCLPLTNGTTQITQVLALIYAR